MSIVYGHDMAQHKMFGDLVEFMDSGYFKEHRYGSLYYDGSWHGIEFFAFLEADAYDGSVYAPTLQAGSLTSYGAGLKSRAVNTRNEVEITAKDHVILLSTCTDASTNGRHILAGKITGEVQPDPYKQSGKEKE